MTTLRPNLPLFGRFSAILLTAVVLGGCATIKSGSHHDEMASFDHYRSFSWIADQPLITAPGASPPISALTQKKIGDAIKAELIRKGFVYSSNREAADFVVSYTVGTRERIEATSYPSAYRGAWGWNLHGRNFYTMEVEHRVYTEGTLGVDVFDGKTKQPSWHGWASKTINSSDREDPAPSIDKAVTALFADFPPGSGRK